MRRLLDVVFFILMLVAAGFTAQYIKAEALPHTTKQVSWQQDAAFPSKTHLKSGHSPKPVIYNKAFIIRLSFN